MRLLAGIALAGLAACSTTYDDFIYEVTQRSEDEVRIQTHKGALNMEANQVTSMFAHMDSLATNECKAFGKSGAKFKGDRRYTTGAYYAWLERIYTCV